MSVVTQWLQRPAGRKLLKGLLAGTTAFGGLAAYLYVVQPGGADFSGPLPVSSVHSDLPDTYFVHTMKEPKPASKKLNGAVNAKVCIIGGGLAGLTTALSLIERGVKGSDVVILEAQQFGWGASARNAGFALNGFQIDEEELDETVGSEWTSVFYGLTQQASRLLSDRVRKHHINCDWENCGALTVAYGTDVYAEETRQCLPDLNKKLGTRFEFWPKEKVRANYCSSLYNHAVYDPTGHSVHPLNLVLGLCRVLTQSGVRLFHHSPSTKVVHNRNRQHPDDETLAESRRHFKVHTPDGMVYADHVVFAGSGYLPPSVHWFVANSVTPLNTYIVVTEPLGDRLKQAMPNLAQHCVCDDRFALDYFRPLPHNRLLWGGRCSVYPIAHADIKKELAKDMARVFPQLADVKIDYAWGGTIALGRKLMPLVGRCGQENLWYSTGFGGHGVVVTTMAGELLAESIVQGKPTKMLKEMQELVPLSYAGGKWGGAVAQTFLWTVKMVETIQLWWNLRKN